MSTTIQWTDETWNPVRGCSLVSAGCANCYAMKQAHRFSGNNKPYWGLTELGPQGPRWNGNISMVPGALDIPLHWKKPRRIFVNSMGDLFHEDIPTEFIDRVFAVMALAHQHTYQILTKRPARMREYCDHLSERCVEVSLAITRTYWWDGGKSSPCGVGYIEEAIEKGPLPNVWLGVSVEDQATADERIPILLKTPAAVRFISAEPLLGPIILDVPWPEGFPRDINAVGDVFDALRFDDCNSAAPLGHLNWVIVGGESGPGARPCDLAWIRSIKDQCQAAGVAVFVKQLGSVPYVDDDLDARGFYIEASDLGLDLPGYVALLKDKKGGDPAEWPDDLRVMDYPKTQGDAYAESDHL